MTKFRVKPACFTSESQLFTTTLSYFTFCYQLLMKMKHFSIVLLDIYIIYFSAIIESLLLWKCHQTQVYMPEASKGQKLKSSEFGV